MLNIFADALLIAARMGRLHETHEPRHTARRSPREFQEVAGLHLGDTLRHQGR